MLQVFDEGRLTDGKGNTISVPDAIFIMTSNLVQDEIRQAIKEGQYLLRPDGVADAISTGSSSTTELKGASTQRLEAQRGRVPSNVTGVGGVPSIVASSESDGRSLRTPPANDDDASTPSSDADSTATTSRVSAEVGTLSIPNTVATIVPAPATSDVDPAAVSLVAKSTDEFLRHAIHPILKRHFRREEFLGRINDIVVFHPLLDADLRQTVVTELGRWRVKAYERHQIVLRWSERLVQSLQSGYDERYGYRSMIYTVEKRVVNLLAAAHERDEIGKGSVVELDVVDDQPAGGKGTRPVQAHQTVVIKSISQQSNADQTDVEGDKKRWYEDKSHTRAQHESQLVRRCSHVLVVHAGSVSFEALISELSERTHRVAWR